MTVCTGNATAASLGMEAAHAMEATLAPGATKVNTLVAAEGLLELNYDMGLDDACVPKGAGGKLIAWECRGKMI